MQMAETVQLVMLTAAIVWETRTDAAASTAVKLCGRKLSEIMSRVCHTYNSPAWDDPRVVEQPASAARRKRQVGIADECCTYGCTWSQLNEYCSISANTESPLEALEEHMIANRSVEEQSEVPEAHREMMSPSSVGRISEVGAKSGSGHGRGRGRGGAGGRRRGRRCWCRRKRRSGYRLASLKGNMDPLRNAVRAAPVVGTVSPQLTSWGRTLNTDLPPAERDRYAYITVHT